MKIPLNQIQQTKLLLMKLPLTSPTKLPLIAPTKLCKMKHIKTRLNKTKLTKITPMITSMRQSRTIPTRLMVLKNSIIKLSVVTLLMVLLPMRLTELLLIHPKQTLKTKLNKIMLLLKVSQMRL